MVSRGVVGIFLTACLVFASGGLALGGAPEAVSPGELDRLVRVRDSCPTFSWGGISGADSLELVIYELGGASADGSEGELRRVVQRSLPGSARGWTPSLSECLSYGGRYAWTVRAVGGEMEGEWSEVRLFEVASAPSVSEVEAALEVLRRYVESGGEVAEEEATEALERLVKAQPAPERRHKEAALERTRVLERTRSERLHPPDIRETPTLIPSHEDALVGVTGQSNGTVGPGIRALTGSGSVGDLHPLGFFSAAAGEFAGPTGVIAAAPSDSSSGVGVIGIGWATNSHGIYGWAPSATGPTRGVTGLSNSESGQGVYGLASATSGYTRGVEGQSDSPNGYGVYGSATATTGSPAGVYGTASSEPGSGVYGEHTGVRGIGVKGVSNGESFGSVEGAGVYGLATSTYGTDASGVIGVTVSGYYGRGVAGYARATGPGAVGTGVYGENVAEGGGAGVHGKSTSPVGQVFGVKGTVYSEDDPVAVDGRSGSQMGTGIAVRGNSSASSGWDFYATGGAPDYGPFTGSHEVKLAEDAPQDLEAGIVLSATGHAEWRRGSEGMVDLSSTLPTVTLSDRPYDPAVFGVLVAETVLRADHWYEDREDERFATVNALGEGRVWVVDAGGPVRAGDYLTTSGVPGYAMRQDDDFLHSYTLGKAIETVDWEAVTETRKHDGRVYKVYLLAVVYTSG